MMKLNQIKSIVMPLCLLLAFSTIDAQTTKEGTTAFQFLKVKPDARANGMGEAFTAVADNADGVYYNPAGLTDAGKYELSMSMYNYFADVRNMGGVALVGTRLGTFAIQYQYNDIGQILHTTNVTSLADYQALSSSQDYFSPNHLMLGLTYARAVTDKFSFGITTKFVQEDLIYSKEDQILFDGGVLYRSGWRTLRTSAVVRHFGDDIVFEEKGFSAPQVLILGFGVECFGPEGGLIGTNSFQRLTLAADLLAPRDYDQQYNIGAEWALKERLFLRGGYKINYITEGLSLGAGVSLGNFKFDYAYNDYDDFLQYVQRFSLSYVMR
ncbi:MAG: PorV/PorQ family protein [FCB group bacterium]|nr:PorV/PorQ family protein [FCB group bacterium]MBL7120410.1 PorV/PorQ family protein [Candidatus Neomarinimicrobiota bacterium]